MIDSKRVRGLSQPAFDALCGKTRQTVDGEVMPIAADSLITSPGRHDECFIDGKAPDRIVRPHWRRRVALTGIEKGHAHDTDP